jgi:hypothetical protein
MPELTRKALFECLRRRRHYATTGGPSGRIHMELSVTFTGPATLYHDDPALGESKGTPCTSAMMGDIVHLPEGDARLSVAVSAASPVQRIDLFNGADHLECHRPYDPADRGNRIAVIWDGAEYRGRFRAVTWDGSAEFDKAQVTHAQAINFFNRDKTLNSVGGSALKWQSVTTGNMAGFIATLDDSEAGKLILKTPLVEATVALTDIGPEDTVFDASGILPRRVRLFRLPDVNPHREVRFERSLTPEAERDNPYYVRVTLEDGTQAWSSPVYVLRNV